MKTFIIQKMSLTSGDRGTNDRATAAVTIHHSFELKRCSANYFVESPGFDSKAG